MQFGSAFALLALKVSCSAVQLPADAVMHAADAVYSGFPIYRRRITARRVPIFVLQPSA